MAGQCQSVTAGTCTRTSNAAQTQLLLEDRKDVFEVLGPGGLRGGAGFPQQPVDGPASDFSR